MFSLYFSLGMLIWVAIHLITRLFHCRKCNKNKASLRQELFEKGDWAYIYNNPDILKYSLLEAEKLADSIYRDIIAVRDRALSIMNYLFLTLGGLFYLLFNQKNISNIFNFNVVDLIFLCGYFTGIILFIAIFCIVPSRNRTKAIYLQPRYSIPDKNNLQDLIEIKIDKLLALEEAIEHNLSFLKSLRQKLFFSVLEIAIIIIFLLTYFLLLSIGGV